MSWDEDKVWKCTCGFSTHNEDVWIEHIRICDKYNGRIVTWDFLER